jgi:hypothetical protein
MFGDSVWIPYLLGSSEQGIVQIIKRVHFGLELKIWIFWGAGRGSAKNRHPGSRSGKGAITRVVLSL